MVAVLKRRLPGHFKVVAGNYEPATALAPGWAIFPDIFVYRGKVLVAVLDAKYKRGYRSRGVVDSSDRWQLACYLYRFCSPENGPLLGLIVPPVRVEDTPVSICNNESLRIGLLGLDLEGAADIKALQKKEEAFCLELRRLIDDVAP